MDTVIVEQLIHASQKEIWRAITEPDQMRQWFFKEIQEFEPKIGFATQFNVSVGERNFMHLWKLIDVNPSSKITYNWRYEGYEGDSMVTFLLIEKGNDTLVRVTHTGVSSFPDDIPEFKIESCRGGWEYFIQDQLKAYLEKK